MIKKCKHFALINTKVQKPNLKKNQYISLRTENWTIKKNTQTHS